MIQQRNLDELNAITREVIAAAYSVHKELGPGLLESVYHACMERELSLRKLKIATKVPISLTYKDYPLQKDFVIDLLVEDCVLLELKAVEVILPVHEAQLLSYLKLTNLRVGQLINFNVVLLKHGIKRMINGY